MKTILNLLSLAMLPLLSACGVTQELKEGVSFANLNRIYVEMPSNSMQNMSYYMNPAEINSVVASDIAEFLKERGYQIVANKADAQIVFVPIWNFSLKDPMTNNPFYNGTTESMMVFNGYYMQNSQYYATLEIQAYLPSREDWVWRGFSPINMDRQNATASRVKEQVRWCLEYFPPEKYPSRLQIYREEREKKRKAEENPFAHIKVEKQYKPAQEASGQGQGAANGATSAPTTGSAASK